MFLAKRQREGMKVSSAAVTDIIKLMLYFVRLQVEAWTMMFGSTELDDTAPIMYWCSYITNPFIGIPNKTTNQWKLFKKCMMELFRMWTTTASLERAFSMGKQLAPLHKSRLKVSTTASHQLIKRHFKLYRERRDRCHLSKRIPIEFENESDSTTRSI